MAGHDPLSRGEVKSRSDTHWKQELQRNIRCDFNGVENSYGLRRNVRAHCSAAFSCRRLSSRTLAQQGHGQHHTGTPGNGNRIRSRRMTRTRTGCYRMFAFAALVCSHLSSLKLDTQRMRQHEFSFQAPWNPGHPKRNGRETGTGSLRLLRTKRTEG